MTVYSGNDDFLSIDGVNVSSYWVDTDITPSGESADTTSGSGTTHRTRNAGLKDHKIKITIVYDADAIATILPLATIGQHTVIYGPQGNGTGKPKHQQVFNFTSVPTKGDVEKKTKRVFTIDGEAMAAPVYDFHSDTF